MKSWYDSAAEFTEAAAEQKLPSAPQKMTKKEWVFLKGRIASEVAEVDKAFIDYENQCNEGNGRGGRKEAPDTTSLIAEQADGMVDIVYYICDAARKSGINLSPIFDAVHGANMTKVDLVTGKCKRRDDGKILKPEGFTPPDIVTLINEQSVAGLKISEPDFDMDMPLGDLQEQLKKESDPYGTED